MNLREGSGKVPVYVGGEAPYILVDFPSEEDFLSLYTRQTPPEMRLRHYQMLKERSMGASLPELSKSYGVSRERVRQIEAKFIRLMRESYWKSKSV